MPTTEQTEKLVLDTHVWIWLMEGDSSLKGPVRRRIEASSRDGKLLISAISVWEVGMLEMKGRITLAEDCAAWVSGALSAPGVSLMPLSPEIALASSRLPRGFHGDPADRIITASARSCGGTLVTADRAILSYAEAGHVRALSA